MASREPKRRRSCCGRAETARQPDRLQPAAHPAIQLNLERNTLYRGDLLPAAQRFFIIKSKEMPGGVQLLAGRRLLSND